MILESTLAILLGLGLAASCGFRVFVPMLIMGAAARADWLTLSEGFLWLESWPALIALSLATALEIGAYYIPWLDNALDTISVPAATLAGTLLMAAAVAEFNPLLKWSLAVIAGGGSAAAVSATTAAARVAATTTTGGLANFVVSTLEWIAAVVVSVLAIVAPFVAAAVLILAVALALKYGWPVISSWFGRKQPEPA